MNRSVLLLVAGLLALPADVSRAAQAEASANVPGIQQLGSQWKLSTATMQRVLALEDGKFMLKSFRDRTTGRELIPPGTTSDEFSFSVNQASNVFSSSSGGWRLVGTRMMRLSQGASQLDVTLQMNSLQVTKSYEVFPGSTIVREWAVFKNAGRTPFKLIQPAFLNLTVRPGDLDGLQFDWMSGGENAPGSWRLKTERLTVAKSRRFDSYEPFPLVQDPAAQFPGDGIRARVFLNQQPVWPATNWQFVANGTVRVPFDLRVQVVKGDKLVFLVNMNHNIGFDTTAFDPTITFDDGESHTASREFSPVQGKNGWNYQYLERDQFVDLVYYPGPNQWRKEKDNATGTPFVGSGDQHPDSGQDAARVWTAPKSGWVRVSGSVCNTGNGGSVNATYGFRPGSGSYAPWYALYHPSTREGIFIGWDYFGHWTSSFRADPAGSVTARLEVAGYQQTLAPGESMRTPKAFVGLFSEDLDNAGNECLDWQYRYLWDYTRSEWFPAIRMLGYWYNGTGWGQSGVPWTGGKPDFESTFRKVFRVADLMSLVGADVYHRDWGWWDRAGDWNGPDFRTTIRYLAKHDMRQLIYAFLYTVDRQSRVAREHPDWLLGDTLDMSRPEVVAFIKGQLEGFVQNWGDFEWRNDSFFTAARAGDDTPMLLQDQGLRDIIRSFLDRHPRCAFQAVNGGGNYGGYDYTRYASTFSFSDGAVGSLRNYYAALLFPPDKTSDIPDVWNPNDYDQGKWRGLLCINFDMTGDTWDPAKLEGVRQLIDIYHYLQNQGVVGRWVKVYRPFIQGDDPELYFQRLSGDRQRGIIIPKHQAPGPVAIRPKGLLPDHRYQVSFHESRFSETRTGADLMARGIALKNMAAGELIYLNLPFHPGNTLDHTPPSPPRAVLQRQAENMGYPGIELSWKPASDDHWVSYYEVFRNGSLLDKVAKGTFYFDHSAGADPAARYEIRTADGAGNVSAKAGAQGSTGQPARILDDAPGAGIQYTGTWEHQTGLPPAHAQTLTVSEQKGATAQASFEGSNLLLFARLSANGGKARITIDRDPPEIIDTYSADEIWGTCVYRRKLDPTSRQHTIRLEVLGEHRPLAKGSRVYLDGVRIQRD